MAHHHRFRRRISLKYVERTPRLNKYSLRAHMTLVVTLAVLIAAAFLAGAIVAWFFAPIPVGPILLAFSGIVMIFSIVIVVSYLHSGRRFYAYCRATEYPTVILWKNYSLTFCTAAAETLLPLLKKNAPINAASKFAPYPFYAAKDLLCLQGKKILLSSELYALLRDLFAGSVISTQNQIIQYETTEA